MSGLECSEIKLSALERTSRIDAEFYSKENLQIEKTLKNWNVSPVTDDFYVSDGNHMSVSDDFRSEGIPYYRGQDIYNIFIESACPVCISEEYYNKATMKRSWLKKNDILLSIVGAIIGNTSMVYTDNKATCSCKLAIIRPTETANPFLTNVFLKSKYGQNQIQKFRRGTAQTGFLLEDMEQLLVPKFGQQFGDVIQTVMEEIHGLVIQSQRKYNEAEKLLLSALGLDGFSPSNANTSIKNFSQFTESGRLDAEYYQPKYDDIEEKLKDYDSTIKKLAEVALYIFTGEYSEEYCSMGENADLRYYIRGTDITNGKVEKDTSHCVNPKGFTKFVTTGDIVTGRVGTIGNFGVIDRTLDNAVYSDNILCFHLPETYIPEAYAVYFNSAMIQQLIVRLARGSVQQRLNQETLREVLVPFIKPDTQQEIAEKVRRSFALREQSKALLKAATRAVEIAIEQDEAAGMDFLGEQSA